VATLLVLLTTATPARAITYGFEKLDPFSTGDPPVATGAGDGVDVSSQLILSVTGGASYADFTIRNAAGKASSIVAVYIDDNAGVLRTFASATIFGTDDPVPTQLPGGAYYGFNKSFGADTNGPRNVPAGLDAWQEASTMHFTLASGKTISDVFAAIDLGGTNPASGLRIGAYVLYPYIYFDTSNPDPLAHSSYINSTTALTTPVPAAVWSGAALLGFLGIGRLLKRK